MNFMEKIKIDRVIIVEGKHDKMKIASFAEACILTTEGFGIFSKADKLNFIRKVAKEKGLLILTDSDSAGLLIRNYIKGSIPSEQIIHLYIPQIKGKERRKNSPSKEGTLGVEGIEVAYLKKILMPYAVSTENTIEKKRLVTKLDLYDDGFFGTTESAQKRKALAKKMNLPDNISSNSLLEAINLLYTYEEYRHVAEQII